MEDLLDAAGSGDLERVKEFLIIFKNDVNGRGRWNFTPLHMAAQNGQKQVVELLLLHPFIAVNAVDDFGRTPLHLGALNNHTEVVGLLLEQESVNVDDAAMFGVIPRHRGGWNNGTEVASLLQARESANVNAAAKFGVTPLHLALERGCTEVVERMLAEREVNLNAQTDEFFTILHMAADSGQGRMVSLLLAELRRRNLDSDMASSLDCINRRPLHYAARGGHEEVVQHFLQHQLAIFDVNVEDFDKFTPLHLAAREGHANVVEELLKSPHINANAAANNQSTQQQLFLPPDLKLDHLPRPAIADGFQETGDHFTPLHLAAREGHTDVVSKLLAWAGINVNANDSDGCTPLHLAAGHGRANVVSLLLANPNVNVNAQSSNKSTPLHLAVSNGDADTLIALMRPGTDYNAKDNNNFTALELAELKGHINVVWYFLEDANIDPPLETCFRHLQLAAETRNAAIMRLLFTSIEKKVFHSELEGRSLLHWAAQNGHVQLVQNFLQWEEWEDVLDVNPIDSVKKQTPLHYAAQYGSIDVLRFLLTQPSLDVNAKNYNGETSLHLAAKKGYTSVVKELCLDKSGQLKANLENEDGKTAFELAMENGHREVEKVLRERPDVKEYVEDLFRDRQVYVDATNASLVGAALIASITFGAWLQPPLGYTPYFKDKFLEPFPAPPGTFEQYVAIEQHPDLQAFWLFNSLSFFFAIATVLSGAGGVLPIRKTFIREAVAKVRRALLWTSLLLVGSVLFVLGAFATAGFVVLPPTIKYELSMIVAVIIGGLVCSIFLGRFLLNLYELRPEWWREKYLAARRKSEED